MPYKDIHEIKFPQEGKQNVILIFGDNMRGKTSLLNAIRWAFYGKAWGRQLRPIEKRNLINWDAAAVGNYETEICVLFESSGNEYELRRLMRPKELISTPKKNEDFETIIGLKRNGILITSDKVTYEINQIMPEQISRFFLFDGELLQEYEMLLIQESVQGHQIKEAIEQVLGVPALINARDEFRVLLKRARANQAQETRKNDKVRAFSEEMEKLASDLETYEKDLVKLITEEEKFKQKISVLEDELSETEGVLKYKSELDSMLGSQRRLTKYDQELRERKLQALVNAWKDMLQPRLFARIKELEARRYAYKQNIEKSGELKVKINNLKIILKKSHCPVCTQKIEKDIQEKIGRELGKLETELELLKGKSDEIGEVSSEISKLSQIRSSGTKDIIQGIDKQLNETNVALTKVENKIDELNEKTKGYDTAEISRKRAKKEQYLKELGRLSSVIQGVREKIEGNNRKQNQLAALISKDPSTKRSRASMQVKLINDLEGVFSEGVDILRDELRNKVADLASNAFKQLTTEDTYLKLDINENYGLSIIDRQHRPVIERSAGAEQIVALALIDGLNRSARKKGPIVMDTPLGRLDPKHRKKLINFMPNMAEQVIMLVHEGEISKSAIFESLKTRISAMYEIDRISSSQSRIIKV